MQILIVTLIVVGIVCFGSKKVIEMLRATRSSLHIWNMSRQGEKEAAKLREEEEQAVYTWKATCDAQAEGQRRAEESRRCAHAQRKPQPGEIVLFDDNEDDPPVDAIPATVLSTESV